MAMISILSAVWNEELYIDEMIRSVLAQTHQEWELLIVDDGSTDLTAEKAHAWSAKDQRIRLVASGAKLGKCRAFNRAWEASNGQVICLLAGDDTLPRDSLTRRARLLDDELHHKAVGFFKIRTFSQQRKFDGAVLPRGQHGSRSGGSITMTRSVAEIVFPIPEALPAEDIWLGYAIEAVAEVMLDDASVVLNYRIHSGNSNPRHKDFDHLNNALHSRNAALGELLTQQEFPLPSHQRRRLQLLQQAEELRYHGKTVEIFRLKELSLIDRLGVAQTSNRQLRALRDRAYLLTSGWRGR